MFGFKWYGVLRCRINRSLEVWEKSFGIKDDVFGFEYIEF